MFKQVNEGIGHILNVRYCAGQCIVLAVQAYKVKLIEGEVRVQATGWPIHGVVQLEVPVIDF